MEDEEASRGSYQTRRDDSYCNRERGAAFLPQRKENPQWNEYSSQHQQNPLKNRQDESKVDAPHCSNGFGSFVSAPYHV